MTLYSTDYRHPLRSIVTADFDNNNRMDIVDGSNSDYVIIFLGYGNGSFAKWITYSIGNNFNSDSVAIGNLNNDNQIDIVARTISRVI